MLIHLETTYGTISCDDIELNRTKLSMALNVDKPIEVLWIRLQEIQRFATAAAEPISDATVIRLTLIVFELTGVFDTVTENGAIVQTTSELWWQISSYTLKKATKSAFASSPLKLPAIMVPTLPFRILQNH
jgi:hypothetical protein